MLHFSSNSIKVQDPHVADSSLPTEKPVEDPIGHKHGNCTVTCVYQTRIAGLCRHVTIIWSKNLMNHCLSITVENPLSEHHYSCKIDLKPWHFWSKKGFKSFEVDGKRIDVFWDLRSAKLSSGSEPYGDYYVAFVCDEEVVLLLGDCKKEAYRRTKCRPSLIDPILTFKKENVFGRKCFSTRAKFDERIKEHDIVIENAISGSREAEMWISIDGITLIHVTNLQWKFRGNETVMVNQVPMQVFWDVHNWMFSNSGSSPALFIFKPGSPANMWDDDKDGSDGGGNDDGDGGGGNYDGDGGGGGESDCYSIQSPNPIPDFCLFLYAWRVD